MSSTAKLENFAGDPRLLYATNTASFSALAVLSGNPEDIVTRKWSTFYYDMMDSEPDFYHAIDCDLATDTVYFTNNFNKAITSRRRIGYDNATNTFIVDTRSNAVCIHSITWYRSISIYICVCIATFLRKTRHRHSFDRLNIAVSLVKLKLLEIAIWNETNFQLVTFSMPDTLNMRRKQTFCCCIQTILVQVLSRILRYDMDTNLDSRLVTSTPCLAVTKFAIGLDIFIGFDKWRYHKVNWKDFLQPL